MKAKYIPNILSVIRIILVFVFVATFFIYPDHREIAIVVFIASGVTDVIDGRLARYNNWVTQAGKILDPVADKMMQVAVLFCGFMAGYVPMWIFLFYALKEFLMGVGSVLFFNRSREIGMSMRFGKFSALLFYIVIGLLILLGMLGINVPEPVKHLMCAATAICSVLTMVFYYRAYLIAEAPHRLYLFKPAASDDPIPLHKRKLALSIVLSVITLGIYHYYWRFLLVKNIRAITKDTSKTCTGEMACLIFVPFYSLYWWYTRGRTVKETLAGYGFEVRGNEVVYLILELVGVGIVSTAMMQNDFNSLPTESADAAAQDAGEGAKE